MSFVQHRADPYERDVSRCRCIRYPAPFHVNNHCAGSVVRASLGQWRQERFVHGENRSFQHREARLTQQHCRAGRMRSAGDRRAGAVKIGVSHYELTGMKMRHERPGVSQGDEQPARRGIEKVYDLFTGIATYADNARASTLVPVAQSSQFTPGRGNCQERGDDGVGNHVILSACDVPASRSVPAHLAGLGKLRNA